MTASPRGTIERADGGGSIRFDRTLPYVIDDVWSALTDPDRLADWWPPFAAQISVDLRVGGHITFEWPDTEFPTMRFGITHLAAPRLLEHTHTSPGSSMRWELEDVPEGTRLLATYIVPDLDVALERGDVIGLHLSLDRLQPALAGKPIGWDQNEFVRIAGEYAAAADADG